MISSETLSEIKRQIDLNDPIGLELVLDMLEIPFFTKHLQQILGLVLILFKYARKTLKHLFFITK